MQYIDKYITHKVLIEYQKNRIVNSSLKAFIELVPELKEILKYIKTNKIENINKDIENQITKLIKEAYRKLQENSEIEIAELAKYEKKYNNLFLTSLIAIKLNKSRLTNKEIKEEIANNKVIDLSFNKSLNIQSIETTNLLNQIIKNNLGKGLSNKQITNKLLSVINTKQSQLNTLIRTTTANIITESNFKDFEDNKDFIKKLKYTAVLDNRTTDVCRENNGKLFSIDQSKGMLPAHWNCRSFWVPVLDEDVIIPENYKEWKTAQKSGSKLLDSDDSENFKISQQKEMTLKQINKEDEVLI